MIRPKVIVPTVVAVVAVIVIFLFTWIITDISYVLRLILLGAGFLVVIAMVVILFCIGLADKKTLAAQAPASPVPVNAQGKKKSMVLLLAILPGFFGVMGLGHIYMGVTRRGFWFLIGGIVLALIYFAGFFFFSFNVASRLGFFSLLLWVVQTRDAVDIANKRGIT